jgi:hypothetical protein
MEEGQTTGDRISNNLNDTTQKTKIEKHDPQKRTG